MGGKSAAARAERKAAKQQAKKESAAAAEAAARAERKAAKQQAKKESAAAAEAAAQEQTKQQAKKESAAAAEAAAQEQTKQQSAAAAEAAAQEQTKQQTAAAAETVDHSGPHALMYVQDALTQYVFAMECTENAVLPYRYTCVHHLASFKTTPSPDKMQVPPHALTFAFMTLKALDLEIAPGKLSKKALDAGWNRHVQITGDIAYIPKERNAAYPSSSFMYEQLANELGMRKHSIVRVERVQTLEMLHAKLAAINADIVPNCGVYVFA